MAGSLGKEGASSRNVLAPGEARRTGLPPKAPRSTVVQMGNLSERDVHRALAVVASAAETGSRALFGIETVDAIVEVIPADEAAYVEWRFGDRSHPYVGRGGQRQPWFEESVAATCDSYPLRDVDHSTSAEPLRITDVVSRARFRTSPFYSAVMRPLGFEHELKLWLPAPPGHARYFELERGPGPDFDERDRSFLSLLRPHLGRLRSRWERRPYLPSLTERELEVLALVAQGLTNPQISRLLFVSPSTVRTHLEHIYDKLGVHSRAGAVSAAFRSVS
jgi:DNA-binding CsgD family transcriptional regulator